MPEIEYNLGDFIRSRNFRENGWNNETNFTKLFCSNYPDTICQKYAILNVDDFQRNDVYYDDININYNLLVNIIEEKKKNLMTTANANLIKRFNTDTTNVHLRIGDTLDNSLAAQLDHFDYNTFLDSTTFHKNGNCYVYPRDYYIKKISILKSLKVNHIYLTAFKYDIDKNSNSYKYTMEIVYLFEKHGIACTPTYNLDPDLDFTLLCNSKYFIPSGGGFSKLVSAIVIKRKGEVL